MAQGHGLVTMINALNINSTVGIFFEDWVEIAEGQTLEYEVSLYEDADLDKVCHNDPSRQTCSRCRENTRLCFFHHKSAEIRRRRVRATGAEDCIVPAHSKKE